MPATRHFALASRLRERDKWAATPSPQEVLALKPGDLIMGWACLFDMDTQKQMAPAEQVWGAFIRHYHPAGKSGQAFRDLVEIRALHDHPAVNISRDEKFCIAADAAMAINPKDDYAERMIEHAKQMRLYRQLAPGR